jgi:hypothetical protein
LASLGAPRLGYEEKKMSNFIMEQYSYTTAKIVVKKSPKAFSERGSKHSLVGYADRTNETDVGVISNKLPYHGWTCLH